MISAKGRFIRPFFFFLAFFLALVQEACPDPAKGTKTGDIEPACVLRKVKNIQNIGNKWWFETSEDLVPILGIRLPNGGSSTGKRLSRYLKARYKGEIIKVCRPNYMPMGKDAYGFIYSEPWPDSLQDELVGKNLALPRKP